MKQHVNYRRGISLRVELQEREWLKAQAALAGLSLQQYCRLELGLELDRPKCERPPEPPMPVEDEVAEPETITPPVVDQREREPPVREPPPLPPSTLRDVTQAALASMYRPDQAAPADRPK